MLASRESAKRLKRPSKAPSHTMPDTGSIPRRVYCISKNFTSEIKAGVTSILVFASLEIRSAARRCDIKKFNRDLKCVQSANRKRDGTCNMMQKQHCEREMRCSQVVLGSRGGSVTTSLSSRISWTCEALVIVQDGMVWFEEVLD